MKIAIFGAGGSIGRRIVSEALRRGHTITTVVRDRSRAEGVDARLAVREGDVLDPAAVAAAVAGHDAVISAVGPGPGPGTDPRMLVAAARSLVAGLPRAGVRRLVVVNGAGSLEVAPGKQLLDEPDFPLASRPFALAHRDALEVYRAADLDWTCLSPANIIEPGTRTGRYRTGADTVITDERGESRISTEDFAVALLDELEEPKFIRQRFTVAY
jgi:putative NADH-flavin reductase